MERTSSISRPAAKPSSAAATAAGIKTGVHVTALDGIVSVNSLFTMSLFIGFSLTIPENATAVSKARCTTSHETVRRLIVFEVVSFSFFLFSSLLALSVKLAINLRNNLETDDPYKTNIDVDFLKYGLCSAAFGSGLGCVFLMLSIIDFVRVKLGSLSCGGKPVFAVVMLVILVGTGLLVYMITAVYASFFVRKITNKYEEDLATAEQTNQN